MMKSLFRFPSPSRATILLLAAFLLAPPTTTTVRAWKHPGYVDLWYAGTGVPNDVENSDNGTFYHQYGHAVAVYGDVLAVGAYGSRVVDSDGVEWDEAGAVYAYRYDSDLDDWIEEQKLTADDALMRCNENCGVQEHQWFGKSVALYEDLLVVGANMEDYGTQGLATNAGAAYVFQYRELTEGGSWQIQALLDPTNYDTGSVGDDIVVGGFNRLRGRRLAAPRATPHNDGHGYKGARFGTSVSVYNDTIAVAAHTLTTDAGDKSGAVYVYRYDDSKWEYEDRLVAWDDGLLSYIPGSQFGRSVSLGSDVLVVGAWKDDQKGNNAGAAYVFRRSANASGYYAWEHDGKLLHTSEETRPSANFGRSVSLLNDELIAVGAPGYDAGDVYTFAYNDTTLAWESSGATKTGNSDGDEFGTSVSLSHGDDDGTGATLAVGSRAGKEIDVYNRTSANEWTRVHGLSQTNTNLDFGFSVSLNYPIVAAGNYANGEVVIVNLTAEECENC